MTPRVALITGCSSGIGLSTAVLLARDEEQRFKVYATMRNLDKRQALDDAGKEQLGKTLIVMEMDVTSDESVADALQTIYDAEETIDILINNAGLRHIGILETQSMEIAKQVFNTNFFGVLRLTKSVIPEMKENRSGHIINITSMNGHNGMPFCGIYCASKFAVEGMSESLAPLLRKFGVKITIVEPGPVNSPSAILDDASLVVNEEGADDETKQLLENFRSKIKGSNNMAQTPDEIAQIILDIVLAEKPHLRYQTNKHYISATTSKLVDPTGDKAVDSMFTRFFA